MIFGALEHVAKERQRRGATAPWSAEGRERRGASGVARLSVARENKYLRRGITLHTLPRDDQNLQSQDGGC